MIKPYKYPLINDKLKPQLINKAGSQSVFELNQINMVHNNHDIITDVKKPVQSCKPAPCEKVVRSDNCCSIASVTAKQISPS